MSARRARGLVAAGAVTASLVVSLALRQLLVEPADVTHRCDAAPWAAADCIVRSLAVQAFIQQRLGIAALVLAAMAWPLRSTTLALVAGALAAAGLVLYGAGWSAPAAVLALLAWVRAGRPKTNEASWRSRLS
jgi:hypothetical protein